MEASFNATNKLIYGNHMLEVAHKYKLVPEEIYSEKNFLVDNGTLVKVLFYNIVNRMQLPGGIAVVDADNCYVRLAHLIALIVFQALGVPEPAISSMLSTIQDMKFFLWMGFGDSKVYARSSDGTKTQGLCQENGTAPAGWRVTSIAMIRANKRKGHGMHIICTILKETLRVVGLLLVDDTDREHLNMNKVETITEAHTELQKSIMNLGRVLIATGREP
jgi:hypothetical protein